MNIIDKVNRLGPNFALRKKNNKPRQDENQANTEGGDQFEPTEPVSFSCLAEEEYYKAKQSLTESESALIQTLHNQFKDYLEVYSVWNILKKYGFDEKITRSILQIQYQKYTENLESEQKFKGNQHHRPAHLNQNQQRYQGQSYQNNQGQEQNGQRVQYNYRRDNDNNNQNNNNNNNNNNNYHNQNKTYNKNYRQNPQTNEQLNEQPQNGYRREGRYQKQQNPQQQFEGSDRPQTSVDGQYKKKNRGKYPNNYHSQDNNKNENIQQESQQQENQNQEQQHPISENNNVTERPNQVDGEGKRVNKTNKPKGQKQGHNNKTGPKEIIYVRKLDVEEKEQSTPQESNNNEEANNADQQQVPEAHDSNSKQQQQQQQPQQQKKAARHFSPVRKSPSKATAATSASNSKPTYQEKNVSSNEADVTTQAVVQSSPVKSKATPQKAKKDQVEEASAPIVTLPLTISASEQPVNQNLAVCPPPKQQQQQQQQQQPDQTENSVTLVDSAETQSSKSQQQQPEIVTQPTKQVVPPTTLTAQKPESTTAVKQSIAPSNTQQQQSVSQQQKNGNQKLESQVAPRSSQTSQRTEPTTQTQKMPTIGGGAKGDLSSQRDEVNLQQPQKNVPHISNQFGNQQAQQVQQQSQQQQQQQQWQQNVYYPPQQFNPMTNGSTSNSTNPQIQSYPQIPGYYICYVPINPQQQQQNGLVDPTLQYPPVMMPPMNQQQQQQLLQQQQQQFQSFYPQWGMQQPQLGFLPQSDKLNDPNHYQGGQQQFQQPMMPMYPMQMLYQPQQMSYQMQQQQQSGNPLLPNGQN